MTDPIADMATRIRNGYLAKKKEVEIPHSKEKEAIANILLQEDYIAAVEVKDNKPQKAMNLILAYRGKSPAIEEITRLSKPGMRSYVRAKKISQARRGFGTLIISTSQGIMTSKEAQKKNLGGEILLKVW